MVNIEHFCLWAAGVAIGGFWTWVSYPRADAGVAVLIVMAGIAVWKGLAFIGRHL